MCKMSKLTSILRGDNAWRIPTSSGLFGFILGISSFGVAMKLSEYKDSPSLPPMLAGIPMVSAGIAGMVGGRMRRQWLISVHMVFCLIASVLSLHLMFLFLGREADSRKIDKAKCQSNFKGSYYCHRYAVTVAMSTLSVLALTLAPLGILSYVVIRRMSVYNVNEAQEVNNQTLESHRDQESTPKRSDERPPAPQRLQQAGVRIPKNYVRKAEPKRNRQHRQASNRDNPDHSRNNRKINQQRNLFLIKAAQSYSLEQSNIPAPGQRLEQGLSNTTDDSFA